MHENPKTMRTIGQFLESDLRDERSLNVRKRPKTTANKNREVQVLNEASVSILLHFH